MLFPKTKLIPLSCKLRRHKCFTFVVYFFAGCLFAANAELTDLTLEELTDIPVVESAKKSGKLFDTPAGAFVFDEDAIENLPVDSIPEMLRYAPGVHIMRPSNGAWGLGIRGMNSRFLSRSLFSVDDQSLYGTLFAGLYGSEHDLLIDDVASVEVVYGPGGSLWGTNAANGRVNVILKSAFETEGSVLRSRVGSQNRSIEGRHGWAIGDSSAARVYAKVSDRLPSDSDIFEDRWKTKRAGFQYDQRPSSKDLVSLSGEVYDSSLGHARTLLDPATGWENTLKSTEKQTGFNAQAKWTHQEGVDNGITLRAWLGQTEFESLYANYELGLVGIESRARYRPAERHKFIFTAGLVLDDETLIDSALLTFRPDYERHNTSAHAGGEYTFALQPERLELSIGVSGYYDTYSGFANPLPSARILFRPSETDRVWLSYSHSTRSVPSGLNDVESMTYGVIDIDPVPISTPFGTFSIDRQLVLSDPQPQIENEELDAFEIGYRKQFGKFGSFVVNGFYHRYDQLLGAMDTGFAPVLTVPNPYFVSNIIVDNIAKGESYGLESSFNWNLSDKQKFTLNYSMIRDSFSDKLAPGTPLEAFPVLHSEIATLNNNVPENMATLWYSNKFAEDWRVDLGVRFTEGFESPRASQEEIFQGDLRLTWEPTEAFRISVVGRNLFDARTDERSLKDYVGHATEQKREAYLDVSYEF